MTANSQLVSLDATNPSGGSLRSFFGMNAGQLAECMVRLGEPSWRGRQLAEAIYRQRIVEVEGISTLPKMLRQKIVNDGWQVGRPRIIQVFKSVDGTERYLVAGHGQGKSADGLTVESVWMPEGDGGEAGDGSDSGSKDAEADPLRQVQGRLSAAPAARASLRRNRATVCVSSQVGCAVNCQFCLTAKLGLQRNLSAGEPVGES